MKKILLLLSLFIGLKVSAQQTYWTPGIMPGSASFTPTFRFIGTDSLVSFSIANSNRSSLVYTAAQSNLRFATSVALSKKLDSVTNKPLITGAKQKSDTTNAQGYARNWQLINLLAGKQPTGNYITGLTGDATASGPGSIALTLATVNSNAGSVGDATHTASITVNAKGLITAASNQLINIPESQVINLVSDLALKAPLASPALTGTPTAPTATVGTNTTQLATTAFVLANASGGIPGGLNKGIQFNRSGAFAADTNFTFFNNLVTLGSFTNPGIFGILDFGDSVTSGFNAGAGNAWTTRFSSYVGSRENNFGIGGATMEGGLGGSPFAMVTNLSAIPTYDPIKHDYLFFMFGINDALLGGSASTFQTNYVTTLNNAVTTKGWPTSRVVVMSATLQGTSTLNTNILPFVTAAMNAASTVGVLSFNAYAYMLANGGTSLVSGDNNHPTPAGYLVIFNGLIASHSFPSAGILNVGNINTGNVAIGGTLAVGNAASFAGTGYFLGNFGLGTSTLDVFTGYNTLTQNGTSGSQIDMKTNGTLVGNILTDASIFYVSSASGKSLRLIGGGATMNFISNAISTSNAVTINNTLSMTSGNLIWPNNNTGFPLITFNAFGNATHGTIFYAGGSANNLEWAERATNVFGWGPVSTPGGLISFPLLNLHLANNTVMIGTLTSDAKAMLDVATTTQGSRPIPPMTITQWNAIASKTNALMGYTTGTNKYHYFDGTVDRTVLDSARADSRYLALTGGSLTGQLNINNNALAIFGATQATDPSIFATNTGIKVGTTGNLTHNYTAYLNNSIGTDNGTTAFTLNIPQNTSGTFLVGLTSANGDIGISGTGLPVLTFNRAPSYSWIPSTAGAYTLGSSSNYWNQLFVNRQGYISGGYEFVVHNTTSNEIQVANVAVATNNHSIFTPTTGSTVNLINNGTSIINPAGALLALTVNLPSSPVNNDVVEIKFTQSVTTVTYANGTVVDGITSPVGGGYVKLQYDSGTTSWY